MPLLFLPLVVVGEGWQEEVAMDGGRARGRGHGGGLGAAVHVIVHDSFDNRDPGNLPLAITLRRPAGIHFGRPLLWNTMTRAVDFLIYFSLLS